MQRSPLSLLHGVKVPDITKNISRKITWTHYLGYLHFKGQGEFFILYIAYDMAYYPFLYLSSKACILPYPLGY